MMKHLSLIYLLMVAVMSVSLSGCIEDGVSSAAGDQPQVSADTIALGSLLTLEPSPTHRFVVRNHHSRGLVLQRVAFADDAEGIFRLNVDGTPGREFANVEIRPNDSIFVFVEATLPENHQPLPVELVRHIEILCNGRTTTIPVTAQGRDAVRLRGATVYDVDTRLEARTYLVYDSLVVAPGARLTLPAGCEMLMHSEAQMVVRGTLEIQGTAAEPVNITGDRSGYVAAKIPYEVMSGQWGGIYFAPTSHDNTLSYASIRNSEWGLQADSLCATQTDGHPGLRLVNCQVRNSKGYVLTALHTDTELIGCELAEAGQGLVALIGGSHVVNHCTLSNNYLFSAPGGPALQLYHTDGENAVPGAEGMPFLQADIANTIIYGGGEELNIGDLSKTQVMVRRCALKANGTDDEQFVSCLWGEAEEMFVDVDRQLYHFDYRLADGSPARGTGDPSLTLPAAATDRYGTARSATSPNIGAYE